jgi:hypothetical protein
MENLYKTLKFSLLLGIVYSCSPIKRIQRIVKNNPGIQIMDSIHYVDTIPFLDTIYFFDTITYVDPGFHFDTLTASPVDTLLIKGKDFELIQFKQGDSLHTIVKVFPKIIRIPYEKEIPIEVLVPIDKKIPCPQITVEIPKKAFNWRWLVFILIGIILGQFFLNSR